MALELGSVYGFLGEEERAKALYVEAIRFARQSREASLLARFYQNLAEMELRVHFIEVDFESRREDDFQGVDEMASQAELYLDEAEAVAARDESNLREEQPIHSLLRARIALLRGDIEQARRLCDAAR